MCAQSSSANRKVLIRADGSQQIGFGHVSRCLALAEALALQGIEAAFAIKSTSDQVARVIARQGYAVHQLAKDSSETHSLFELAQHQQARVVCIDTYEADAAYLQALKDFGLKAVFIDDFARSPISADIIVNYNAYAPDLTYQVGPATRLLLGPRYALLQQRFKKARDYQTVKLKHENVLVIFGGSDLHNWSAKIASALLQSLPETVRVTVITGPASVTRHELEALAKTISRLEVELQPEDLPAIMATACLAISGAGVTAYELACLGVPSLLMVLADNQFRNAKALDRFGIATSLGWHENLRPEEIAMAVAAHLADTEKLARMSERGRQLVDGMGAERVAKEILYEIDSRV
jgi:UDP-2,4-diacetamido-2,4,6-trideoxy-beta-L-altropyranose hydrolase